MRSTILIHGGEHGGRHPPKELPGFTVFMFHLAGAIIVLYIIYSILKKMRK